MNELTIEDFVMWKAHPVTRAVFKQLSDRRESIKDYLVSTAGDDPKQDAVQRGYALAIQDLLTIEYGDTQDA